MVLRKGKRKIMFAGKTYYWFIRKNKLGHPYIHILSEDKALHLKTGFDREIGIGAHYIECFLAEYFGEEKENPRT